MTPKPGFFKPESPAIIRAAEDVYRLIRSLSRRMRESVYTLLLDPENALIEMEEISRGSTGLADAYPDQVFSPALEKQCRSLILVHNHPSGIPEPSYQDRCTTKNLYRWGRDLGIDLRFSPSGINSLAMFIAVAL
jgi:DNA repair protein RadC